jgi:divalent metal cation (Fe/Co/Zn/Cd) transporter
MMMQKEQIGVYSIGVNLLLVAIKGVLAYLSKRHSLKHRPY